VISIETNPKTLRSLYFLTLDENGFEGVGGLIGNPNNCRKDIELHETIKLLILLTIYLLLFELLTSEWYLQLINIEIIGLALIL
jgi:hypothetical protein